MIKNKNLRLYEALAHEVALEAAERGELTAEQRALSRRMLAFAHDRLADAERVHAKPRTSVRAAIAAMQRPSLLQRLGEILACYPGTVFAHRDLKGLSDDDLRVALEDAERMIERMV